jgi:hypothetical protein
MSESHPLPPDEYWHLVAVTQRVTIAQLEAKWAIAKAEAEREQTDAALRARYQVDRTVTFQLAE